MKQVDNNVAVSRLACALRDYDRANPDVGMGPSDDHFIWMALRELELTEADFNHAKVSAYMSVKR